MRYSKNGLNKFKFLNKDSGNWGTVHNFLLNFMEKIIGTVHLF